MCLTQIFYKWTASESNLKMWLYYGYVNISMHFKADLKTHEWYPNKNGTGRDSI